MSPKLSILDIPIDPVTLNQASQKIIEAIKQGQKYKVYTVNPEFIVAASRDTEFKKVLSTSSLNLPDGVGIIWAANFLSQKNFFHQPALNLLIAIGQAIATGIGILLSTRYRAKIIPERVAGVDLSYHLIKESANSHFTVFFLGGQDNVAELAAQKLLAELPGLQITGTYAGDGSPTGDTDTREQIVIHPADLLLIAYGAPKQEYWIDRNLQTLPATAAIGVGGTFSYLSGQLSRAPYAWRRLGLEWLYRLIRQPWRLRRQLALPQFIWLVIRYKASHAL